MINANNQNHIVWDGLCTYSASIFLGSVSGRCVCVLCRNGGLVLPNAKTMGLLFIAFIQFNLCSGPIKPKRILCVRVKCREGPIVVVVVVLRANTSNRAFASKHRMNGQMTHICNFYLAFSLLWARRHQRPRDKDAKSRNEDLPISANWVPLKLIH